VPGLQRALFGPLTRLPQQLPAVWLAPRTVRFLRHSLQRARSGLTRLVVVGLLVVAAPPAVRAQAAYARFDVTTVDDTTFTFATTGARWVKRGQKGLVVDPAHGDELIAQFRVSKVGHARATAVVTGQTARLTTAHVALLEERRAPFFRRAWFWIGVAIGGAIGYVAHR
jgi:hypothetical protein